MVDKTDVTLKAFDHARAEIIERLKMRDTALLAHITASLTFGGVYFGFATKQIKLDDIFFLTPLTLILPLLSLVFAQLVSQHTGAIELVARFIRAEIDPLLLGAPHWDKYTHQGGATVQISKTKLTFWKHMLVLHAPTICLSIASVFALALSIKDIGKSFDLLFTWQFSAAFQFVRLSAALSMFFFGTAISIALYVLAVAITWRSFAARFESIKKAAEEKRPASEAGTKVATEGAQQEVKPAAPQV